MQLALQFRETCLAARLRRGTELRCLAGTLWLTVEWSGMRGPSPDIVLLPGERYRVPRDALFHLTALEPGVCTTCEIDLAEARLARGWRGGFGLPAWRAGLMLDAL